MDFFETSKNIRTTILKMICKSKSSHIGSAFSSVDVMTYLYIKQKEEGDKVIFSKGHAGSVLYATLAEMGKIDKEILINTYCQNGQSLGGHVTLGTIDGVDATAGSLGHGLSMGIGMALSLKNQNVFVLVGDGEINEGSIWEGFLFAPQKKLNNLIVIIDRNKQQGLGETEKIISLDKLNVSLDALGWCVQTINGHDFDQIEGAFNKLSKNKPNIIIADTIKGKGVDFMENNIEFHYKTPNEEQYQNALHQINS
ncbi:MAG: transketolase [Candidatus Absconditabacteria bacterium]|nr:transketolase [Candidatus Absconditabacteria bacterium]